MKRLAVFAVATVLAYLAGAVAGRVLVARALRTDTLADFGGDDS